jgi:hypothetical protein
MGFMKELEISSWERGFGPVPGHVCPECVSDVAIKDYITANATSNACDFCGQGASVPIAAEADLVVDLVSRGIKAQYDIVENELIWDSEEKKYIGTFHDAAELLGSELDAPIGEGAFADAVYKAAQQCWCERGYYHDKPHEQLAYDWELFVDTVKHFARYTFLLEQGDSVNDVIGVGHEVRRGGAMLKELGRLIDEAGLVRRLPANTTLYRCRPSASGTTYETGEDIGSPPADRARSSRMSPAGIPMFYAAFDEDTAIAETIGDQDVVVSVGTFVTESDCWIVDLDELPEVPSLFDDDRRHLRSAIRFLHGFREDLVKPIARDDRVHYEYVPTQIVTEYLRYIHRGPDGVPLTGLAYGSSRHEGRCIVLFITAEACVDGDDESTPSTSDLVRVRLRGATARRQA